MATHVAARQTVTLLPFPAPATLATLAIVVIFAVVPERRQAPSPLPRSPAPGDQSPAPCGRERGKGVRVVEDATPGSLPEKMLLIPSLQKFTTFNTFNIFNIFNTFNSGREHPGWARPHPRSPSHLR